MTETMIERVAKAIEDAQIGYSIKLTSLVDGVSTYTLTYADDLPLTFTFGSYEDASEHVRSVRRQRQARAAIEAMRVIPPDLVELAIKPIVEEIDSNTAYRPQLESEWLAGWSAAIDAALSEKAP